MVKHEYPEHEKLAKIKEQSQAIGEFLEWLESKHRSICKWQEGITEADRIIDAFATAHGKGNPDINEEPERGWFPICQSIEKTLAEFFNIDLNKLEQEKRQILEEIRADRKS